VGSERLCLRFLREIESHHPTRWARNRQETQQETQKGGIVTIPHGGLGTLAKFICFTPYRGAKASPSHTVGSELLRVGLFVLLPRGAKITIPHGGLGTEFSENLEESGCEVVTIPHGGLGTFSTILFRLIGCLSVTIPHGGLGTYPYEKLFSEYLRILETVNHHPTRWARNKVWNLEEFLVKAVQNGITIPHGGLGTL
jgi:hypothetical protein